MTLFGCHKSLFFAFLVLGTSKSWGVSFDTSLLAGDSAKSDLSRFYEEQSMPAGTQEMDVFINGDWKGRYSFVFTNDNNQVLLSKHEASLLGIKLPEITSEQQNYSLEQLVQGGSFDVDVSTLSIKMSIPQSFLLRTEAGYVPPEFWENGIPAAMLSYNTTYYKTHNKRGDTSSSDDFYAGLESGINFSSWQFRDSSSVRKHAGNDLKWQNNTRYLRKALPSYKSNFIAGDFYSQGTLFDSVRVRGASFASDINMRPTSQQGFAPIVRGVAQTNALVKVMQNGSVIYQENVPPGQFTIDNIQPTGSAGDLLVIVKEADGQEQSFTVPFSAVPGMLKEGVSNYALLAGKVNQENGSYQPKFFQGTFEYGFNNLITGYTGVIASEDYQAYLLGSGWNFPIGAVAVDITHAKTKLPSDTQTGQSMRVSYSKFLNTTATNFTLAAYRYSTKGYYSFSDAIHAHEGYRLYQETIEKQQSETQPNREAPVFDMNTWDSMRGVRPKNTFTINLNQRLPENWGTLYISGSQRDYWSTTPTTREYQLGYSNAYANMSYSLSASRVRDGKGKEENRYYVSISFPLSLFDNDMWVSTGFTATDSRYQQSTVSLSGTALESNRLSYSLSGSNQQGGQNMASANVAYRSNISTIGSSISESNDYRQTGLNARGSLVAIPWELLASNEIGNTMTIVKAPKAQGLMVNGDQSIITNKEGLALVPYATPYRKNTITLSNTENTQGAEVIGNIANSAPIEGSVNLIKFKTDTRSSWISRAVQKNGSALPFGAEVTDLQGEALGYVGQASMLYLKAETFPKSVIIRLNNGTCTIHNLPDNLDGITGVCQ
ncbi:fimbria/pilus outer membrane usher protein [Providencia vermicola]|uniref:Fimbrial biogenesis outer membrane usher protein n=1 Tax=Providencia vermicola TaxID=333965 RepID=A0AAX3S0Y3_9GAMM|nr:MULTISPECIES: fimbria/pilus outer membrane usher protein [Providencia]ELX8380508.1 fimbrial biogenesis outer membrane usher protein [Providencia stuartii]EMD5260045.1 fimbrial biogenesis outer membrane usher protein [Providencia stuartii]USB38055.1 fimbrial biogenesis outer membrane usher protein [Providencia vermicola]WFC06988.1 fimbrial biogenesis outer membrane usher protein [Providencia vermicola]